jgi:hypothetical protein
MGAIFVVEFDGVMWVTRVNKAEDIIFGSFGGIANGKVDACIVPERAKKGKCLSCTHNLSLLTPDIHVLDDALLVYSLHQLSNCEDFLAVLLENLRRGLYIVVIDNENHTKTSIKCPGELGMLEPAC